MQLKFISNACEIFVSGGKKLLCDPWLTEGAFEGSWYHYPPLKTQPEDVADYDYLYISHIDPDHFDPRTLEHFDKTKPVIILKFKNDYLKKNLEALGFQNIYERESEVPGKFGPFTLTLFGPFQKTRLGTEAKVGNVIDSAILVEAEGFQVLNTVDNLPSLETARKLQNEYGPFDLVQLNYNSAGPYPDCFIQYSKEERKLLADEFLVKQLTHFCELAKVFSGAKVMPFAGDYVLVGKEWEKNFYNSTCTPDYAIAFMEDYFIQEDLSPPEFILLNEGYWHDFKFPRAMIVPFQIRQESDFSRLIYAHENRVVYYPHEFESKVPPQEELIPLLQKAYEKLNQYRERFGISLKTEVHLYSLSEDWICSFSLSEKRIRFEEGPDPARFLNCYLDLRLLWRLLHKKANWNNAEIGAHIEFARHPDIYEQDVHLLLNFFHL